MGCIKIIRDEDFGLKSVEFRNPRIRYGARGIIVNNEGKIAVFNKVNKNEYKLPGGEIDKGETPEEAFIREALEETGCEIEIIKNLGTIEEHKSLDDFKQISHVFVAKVVKDSHNLNLTKKEKDEGAKLIWVYEDEALTLVTNCFEKLKESKYEKLEHVQSIVMRDRSIIEYYIKNK